ncbi:MAG TPA: hypothetical protein VK196_02610 [Magnetospirillum sp.]|nr:hypothetical protein [Magnetospirillum sp.]
MTEKQWGLLIISPMIAATGVALWRQGALGGKALIAATLATAAVTAFLVLMQ